MKIYLKFLTFRVKNVNNTPKTQLLGGRQFLKCRPLPSNAVRQHDELQQNTKYIINVTVKKLHLINKK